MVPKSFMLMIVCLIGVMTYPATAQQLAITLDDLPYVMPSRMTPEQGVEIVTKVNDGLAVHGIIATGFVFGQQVNEKTRPALVAFAEAGHTIGNHSWSHADYGTLTARQFRRETRRTDRVIAEWLDGPRYYRFPYLREGPTEAAMDKATRILSDLGYVNVPVTIDNDEWRFNAEYVDALEAGDTGAAQKIAKAYLRHMQERTIHFQTLARMHFGRDVKHILLLHMNRINADHLGALLGWYKARGWTFISVDEALTDPIFTAPDLYAGDKGLSQIERVLGAEAN